MILFIPIMSKLGKKPIKVPQGVEVEEKEGFFYCKGPKGELRVQILPFLKVQIKEGEVIISPSSLEKQAKANWGTMAALIRNALEGVVKGYTKSLIVEGVGYRASKEGDNLVLHVGFSHPVKFKPPAGIEINVDKNTIKVGGIDKALVGQVAAQIRKIKKPEPYKGKGIRYEGEVIRRKQGKKAVGAE